MLVQFTFENFKSFKRETKLSMVASRYYKENTEGLVKLDKYDLLKYVAILGPNASGKSKLLEAMQFMSTFVQTSIVPPPQNITLPSLDPFRLSTDSKESSSIFEMIFIISDVQYRYGFELTKKEIVSEWLFRKVSKETLLFYREDNEYEYSLSEMKKIKGLIKENMIRKDALLLSVLAQFNDELANGIVSWFSSLSFLTSYDDSLIINSLNMMAGGMKQKMLSLMREADFNIVDITSPEKKSKVTRGFKTVLSGIKSAYEDVASVHNVYDEYLMNIESTKFRFFLDESSGTIKFFGLTAPIIETLENGSILIVDELEAGLHPDLVNAIIKLFLSEETNPKNAQIIFNTQDTTILNSNLFRRDQFYFVEKDRYGESTLSSVAKFKVKSDSNMEKRYLEGRFGALPYLKHFGDNLKKELPHENEK